MKNWDRHSLALLAIFAHPDDETFRSGGTLALLAHHGVRVELLTFTRGQSGSCGDPPRCTPDELPEVREQELRCACATLNIQSPRLLDYMDGHLQEAEIEPMVAQILSAADVVRPQVWLSFGPDGLSGHPDHLAVSFWARGAFERCEQAAALYTVAVPHSLAQMLNMPQIYPVPDEAIALTVDVSPVWDAKMAALQCHATQWSSSPMASASEARRRLFFEREYFVRAARRDPKADWLATILQKHLV